MPNLRSIESTRGRIAASCGGLLILLGGATLAIGAGEEMIANRALNENQLDCEAGAVGACQAVSDAHEGISEAIQMLGNGVMLCAIGGSAIWLAKRFDKTVSAPVDIDKPLDFEQEFDLLVRNQIPTAKDIPNN